jgi:hypothetical protein
LKSFVSLLITLPANSLQLSHVIDEDIDALETPQVAFGVDGSSMLSGGMDSESPLHLYIRTASRLWSHGIPGLDHQIL